jgi:hypothetical protein
MVRKGSSGDDVSVWWSPAVMSPDVFSLDVLSLRTFRLRMLCFWTFCLGTWIAVGHVVRWSSRAVDQLLGG